MFKLLSFVVTLVFIAIGVMLGVLNPTPIQLDLFIIQPVLPLSLIMAVVLVLGMLIASILIMFKVMHLKWQIRKSDTKLHKQASEIIELKKKLAKHKLEAADTTVTAVEPNTKRIATS